MSCAIGHSGCAPSADGIRSRSGIDTGAVGRASIRCWVAASAGFSGNIIAVHADEPDQAETGGSGVLAHHGGVVADQGDGVGAAPGGLALGPVEHLQTSAR